MEASLQEILNAREHRVQKQNELLSQFQKPLLCFTMNIPGPEKWNRDVAIGFYLGCWFLEDALKGRKLLHKQITTGITGGEGYYVVDMPAKELKKIAMEIEQVDPVGRLFDMDVLTPEGAKLSRQELGQPPRTCLLCDNEAVICARSRAHSLEELKNRTGFYLYVAARELLTEYVASRAYFALYQEVSATPKPGLVDRSNTGSHRDMNIRHFFVSANALRPFFAKFTEEGFLTRDLDPKETFRKIRPIGLEAEEAMLQATRGVNTHKGAIFSMGLLCAAAGRLAPDCWSAENLLAECGKMTEGIIKQDFAGVTAQTAKTAGELFFARYGITGVRGQAEAGFPAVKDVGLPLLKEGLAKRLPFDQVCGDVLLHLLAATDDTNLISRSDRLTQQKVKEEIIKLLQKDPFPQKEVLEKLDAEFIEKNLSPGGSADLLALTLLLFFLETVK